jgi:hypothetical protein
MSKISLVFAKQHALNKSMLIISGIVFALTIISIYFLKTLIVEYRQQLFEFQRLSQSYDVYARAQDAAMSQPKNESLSIDLFDQVMGAKPQHLFFDRMKISKNSPLQIEGVTIKPLEIDEFIRQVESSGLKLQISQVQKDSEQQVRFDLRQGS